MAWTGFGWTWAGLGDERAFPARVWSVIAAVADGERMSRRGGVVVSADLDLAAAQLCAHLDADLADEGRCYLFASRGSLDPSDRGTRSATRLVAVVHRDAQGAVIPGEWRAADDSIAVWGGRR